MSSLICRKPGCTCTSFPPQAQHLSTTPTPLVLEARVPRRTSSRTLTSSKTVSRAGAGATSREHFLISGPLPELINHGLSALHDTLQQDKHLSISNTSIAIIGPADEEGIEKIGQSAAARKGAFRVWENEDVDPLLRAWRRSRGEPEDGPKEEEEEAPAATAEETAASGDAAAPAADAPTGSDDVTMSE